MIARGMTIEEVAELLGLAIAQVRQATAQQRQE
jgi:predicted transposase YdaD